MIVAAALALMEGLSFGQAPPSARLSMGSGELRTIFNDLACAYHAADLALVRSDQTLKRHLLDTRNPYVWIGLAGYRLRAAEFGNAVLGGMALNDAAEAGVRLGPDIWEAHWILAKVRRFQRRFPEAQQLLAKAEKLGAPRSALAIGSAELALQWQHPESAERALRAGIRGDGAAYFPDSTLQLLLGAALQSQRRADDAIAAFRAAERDILAPGSNCMYLAMLGQVESLLLYRGDAIEAERLIGKLRNKWENDKFPQLEELLTYVKLADAIEPGRTFLTPAEAALELVKYPIGSKVLPVLLQKRMLPSVDILDGKGNSLLILAAWANQPSIAQLLIKAGAKVDLANGKGQRALGVFCLLGSSEGIRVLLDANAQTSYRDHLNITPLAAAVSSGNPTAVRSMLDRSGPAPKSALDDLLVQAAYFGMLDVVRELAKQGASLRPAKNKGMPPLIAAILSGNRQLVAWMLDQKADVGAVLDGRPPIDVARDMGDPEMIRLLTVSRPKSS